MRNLETYRLGIKNIIYTIFAQGVSFVLGIGSNLILPILMGVAQFGYWQVYFFYSTYIMFFCLGFNDGLYLKYGRFNYNELNFEKLRSAMRVFIIIITILSIMLFMLSFFENDKNKIFAFRAISLNLLIVGVNNTLLTILQFTNRIKLSSILYVSNRLIFISFIIILLIAGLLDFRFVIIADVITKIILLCINIYKSKELFVGSTQRLSVGLHEFYDNVSVGSKLMLANIAGSLVVGIGRFIIERYMPIESFSLYSFATNLAFFALTFISVASISLYPLLKRLPEERLPKFYVNLNPLLCTVLFALLLCYYPVFYLIQYKFTAYTGILEYFYLLFIIIVSQGKMQFLINTYYKVLREEKAMLVANISGAVVAMVVIIPTFYYTHSIFAIVAGTTLTLIWRCYASEIYLKKKMGIKGYGNIVVELVMMGLFIICVISGKPSIGFVLYLLAVCVYGFINRVILLLYFGKIIRLMRG